MFAYLNFLNENLAYDMFIYKFLRQNVQKLYANITQVLTDAIELNHEPAWKVFKYLHKNLSSLFFNNKNVLKFSQKIN